MKNITIGKEEIFPNKTILYLYKKNNQQKNSKKTKSSVNK